MGRRTLRQVFFASLDLHLHRRSWEEGVLPNEAVALQQARAGRVGPVALAAGVTTGHGAAVQRVASEVLLLPLLQEDRLLNSFLHIFAGGCASAQLDGRQGGARKLGV